MKYFKLTVFFLVNILMLLIISGMIYTIYYSDIPYPQLYHEYTPFPITQLYLTVPLVIIFLSTLSMNYIIYRKNTTNLNTIKMGLAYFFFLLPIWNIVSTWLIRSDISSWGNPDYISYFGKYVVFFQDYQLLPYNLILFLYIHSLFLMFNLSKYLRKKEFR